MGDSVLLEIEALQPFGIVLDQHTLTLGLNKGIGTYLSCFTIAQIIEFQMSKWMMLSWVRFTYLGLPSIFFALSVGIYILSCTSRFLPSFSNTIR